MAKKKSRKPAARAATKKAAQEEIAGPAKAAAKSTARRKLKSKGKAAVPAKRARPKQRIAISHHRDEDFKADGLRAYAQYRDLGIADATHGLARAHVIRLISGRAIPPRCRSCTPTTSNSRWSTCSRAG